MKIVSRTSRTSVRVLAAAAAALTLSLGAAYAAGVEGPGGSGAPWQHHDGNMIGKQLEQLHAKLKLTPAQEQLWQAAIDTMKRDRTAERANHEKMHEQFKAMQQQPILDLNALNAAHEQQMQENARLHEETAKAWLAVYNALDDQQKTMVSDLLKQHFARMGAIHERMHERWQQRQAASGASAANP
jgi:Spy/CpxP family protein refolding chaperone